MIEYSISKNHFQLVQTRATVANQKSGCIPYLSKKGQWRENGARE
jgi:hypothetical protein